MTKHLSLTIILGLIVGLSTAQKLPKSVVKNPLDWKAWEVSVEDSTKHNIVEALHRTESINMGLGYYGYSWEHLLEYYHILDFNRDGHLDVVYNGFGGKSNNVVMLFEKQGETYTKTMLLYGDIVEIFQTDLWAPLSFKILNVRCCNNYVNFLETYVPYPGGGINLKYKISNKLAYVTGSRLPNEFTRLQPFKIVRDSSELRILPKMEDKKYDFLYKDQAVVDTVPHSLFFKHEGNVTALINKDAGGFILAEFIDQNEELWYFVSLASVKETSRFVFCSTGDNNSALYSIMGWIKSGDVEIIEYVNQLNQKPELFFIY